MHNGMDMFSHILRSSGSLGGSAQNWRKPCSAHLPSNQCSAKKVERLHVNRFCPGVNHFRFGDYGLSLVFIVLILTCFNVFFCLVSNSKTTGRCGLAHRQAYYFETLQSCDERRTIATKKRLFFNLNSHLVPSHVD